MNKKTKTARKKHHKKVKKIKNKIQAAARAGRPKQNLLLSKDFFSTLNFS